jgi:hypothetical protein
VTDPLARWRVKVQGPAQGALADHLPVCVATAALEFIQHVLTTNPYESAVSSPADMRDYTLPTLASTGSSARLCACRLTGLHVNTALRWTRWAMRVWTALSPPRPG